MSGNRDFDRERFRHMAGYIMRRQPMPALKLAWVMFRCDFDAYAQLGESITGATYLKGDVHPEVREMGIGWFEWAVRRWLPWWARAGGTVLTAYAVVKAVKAKS